MPSSEDDIKRIRCAGCQAKLKLPAGRDINTLRCPRCGAPVQPALVNGKIVGGYKIIKPIAKGGMGEVFVAEASDGSSVALKVMAPDCAKSEELVARFKREGQIGSFINHQHAVACFACEEDHERLYMAMELVTGGEMGRLIKKHGGVGWRRGLKYGLQLAELLAHMTQVGVVHRDIKPNNLMLDGEGQLKLADFGLSKLLGRENESIPTFDLTVAGSQLGTPAYMPPEQIEDAASVTPAADVYAFGATLYAMIGGTRPIPGKGTVEVIDAVMNYRPPPLHTYCPDCPAALEELLDWCMAKKYDHRPRDGVQLFELMKVVNSRPNDRQYIRDQRAVVVRSGGQMSALIGLIVVGVALLGVLAWWLMAGLR